jgi:hypothetical protein
MKLACILASSLLLISPVFATAQRGQDSGKFVVTPDASGQGSSRAFKLGPKSPLLGLDLNETSRGSVCPIGMQVKQGTDGDMVKTRDRTPAVEGPGQRIHLLLNNTGITGADVRVSGLTARPHVAQSGSGSVQPGVTRTLHVSFSPDGEGGVRGTMKLVGFTSVTSVRLVSVTYADGTEWTVPSSGGCSARPDPVMLIAGR